MYRLQPDAAASLASHATRSHLRVVGGSQPRQEHATPANEEPATAPSTERSLLDAWREAHWTLRMRVREVLADEERADIEAAYDTARRADNRLMEFHQARADHLARRLRASLVATSGVASGPDSVHQDPVDNQEHALLRHFRALAEEDRASLVRLAARLSVPATATDA